MPYVQNIRLFNKEKIMDTILVQVNDKKAYGLIEDLEALDIIKVLERNVFFKINFST